MNKFGSLGLVAKVWGSPAEMERLADFDFDFGTFAIGCRVTRRSSPRRNPCRLTLTQGHTAPRFPHNRSLDKTPRTHALIFRIPRSKMPLEFIPLHKTFAAEVRGVDFSKPVPKDVMDEIIRGADKYGVLVFRKTGMTDEAHIQFSKHFGDLDDISGYIPPGVPMSRRTRFLELFDASNLDANGNPLPEHEKRYQYNKVCQNLLRQV